MNTARIQTKKKKIAIFIQDQQNLLHFHLPYRCFLPKIQEIIYFKMNFKKKCLLPFANLCTILSSDTEEVIHGSVGFREKSEILPLCQS
jgi:hypothetical protein